MKEVLQPLNDKAANAIVDHIDLIEASSVDPLLLKLVAYVKTVRVMMSRYVRFPVFAQCLLYLLGSAKIASSLGIQTMPLSTDINYVSLCT